MNELFMNVFIQYSSVIRDFLRINDTFRLFYMISLLFARVINLERVAPVGLLTVRAFCVPTQGRLKTYVLLTEFLNFMYSTPLLSSVMD